MKPSLLDISEKIYYGIYDKDTNHSRFGPLWKYPILVECLISALQSEDEIHRKNFETVCSILCPEFINVIDYFIQN